MRLLELTLWSVDAAEDGRPVVTLAVEADGDGALTRALDGDPATYADGFAGQWRAGARGERTLVSFLLVEEADPGLERAWWTHDFDRALLEAVSTAPHDVVVQTADGRGVRIEVEYASARVAELLEALA